MNANPLATLHEVETYLAEREDVIDGDYGQPAPNAEMTLLREVRAAIRALSADRGEAVAYRWWRNGEPQGFWINGQPTQQQFAAAEQCKDRAEWTIEYAYAATPPSPAESAEVPRGVWEALQRMVEDGLLRGPASAEDARLVAQWRGSFAAAPSQVSDADRAWRFSARELLRELTLSLSVNGARMTIDNDALRSIDQRARHLLTGQPQPGRVEGMVLVPVDEIERAVKVMRYAAHPHASPNADALAKFIAPRPTAGGTRNAHDLAKSGAMVDRVCKCCGAKFTARAADVKRGWARFCSKSCKATQQSYPSDRDLSDIDDDQSWGEHELWDARP